MNEEYTEDKFGIVHYNGPVTAHYDYDYVHSRYDQYTTTRAMSRLRERLIGRFEPGSLLDYGYGNGDFLRVCLSSGIDAYGYDVSGYPLPRMVQFSEPLNREFDMVTFFDSLEHIDNPSIVGELRTRFLAISVPWMHEGIGTKWFHDWKHRRPGEHLWHFCPSSLLKFTSAMGYECIQIGNYEDEIRGTLNGRPNILTGIFKRS